jgi:hypothetical protein
MPSVCCVPGCKSNYKSSDDKNVPVFRFPSDIEKQKEWVRAIHRADFQPTKRSVVCIKHFSECNIIREDSITRPDGSVLTVPRRQLKLNKDAVPNIFPNLPSYLTVPTTSKRKAPEERRREQDRASENVYNKWCESDNINSYDDFRSELFERGHGEFLFKDFDNCALFFKIECEECPKLTTCFKIFHDLSVNIYFNGVCLPIKKFFWIFGPTGRVTKWSMFDTLVSHMNSYSSTPNLLEDINAVSHSVDKIVIELGKDVENEISALECDQLKKLKFLKEQLDLITANQTYYSADTLVWATCIAISFPNAYRFIRNSGLVSLPHPGHLHRLSANVKSEVGLKKIR